MEKNWLIIFILISSFNVKAQNQNLDVIRLLDQFYEKLSIQDIDNSYLLSLKIDSLIPASKSLLLESLFSLAISALKISF